MISIFCKGENPIFIICANCNKEFLIDSKYIMLNNNLCDLCQEKKNVNQEEFYKRQ